MRGFDEVSAMLTWGGMEVLRGEALARRRWLSGGLDDGGRERGGIGSADVVGFGRGWAYRQLPSMAVRFVAGVGRSSSANRLELVNLVSQCHRPGFEVGADQGF